MIRLQRCPVRAVFLARVYPQIDASLSLDLIAFLYFHFFHADPERQRQAWQDYQPVVDRYQLQDWSAWQKKHLRAKLDAFDQSKAPPQLYHAVCPPWLEVLSCIVTVADAMLLNGSDITHVELVESWNDNWHEFVSYDDLHRNTQERLQTIADRILECGDVKKLVPQKSDLLKRERRLIQTGYDLQETFKLMPLRAVLAYGLHCALCWNQSARQRQILRANFSCELDAIDEVVRSNMLPEDVAKRLVVLPKDAWKLTSQHEAAIRALESDGDEAHMSGRMLRWLFSSSQALRNFLLNPALNSDSEILLNYADSYLALSAEIWHEDGTRFVTELIRARLGFFPDLGKAIQVEVCSSKWRE